MDRIIREILLYSEEVEEILEYVRLETFRALLFIEQQYLNIRIDYGCASSGSARFSTSKVLFIFRCSKNWQKKSVHHHLLANEKKVCTVIC